MSNAVHFVLTPAILKALRASRAIVVSSNLDENCAVVDGAANQDEDVPAPWFRFTHNPKDGLGRCLMLAAAEVIKSGRAGADHGREQR
jgi:hypothetical protein